MQKVVGIIVEESTKAYCHLDLHRPFVMNCFFDNPRVTGPSLGRTQSGWVIEVSTVLEDNTGVYSSDAQQGSCAVSKVGM